MRYISLFFIITLITLSGCGAAENNQPINNDNGVVVSVKNENTNVSLAGTYTGMVFIKGYQTPSESYGIVTENGDEIGLEEYDLNKEIFRDLVNKNIIVNFNSVCLSAQNDCCRSLFYYCGQINSWQEK